MNQIKTWTRGNLTYLQNCPACNKDIKGSPLFKRYDDENIMLDEWSIYNCEHCSSSFINPRPSIDSLPALYQDYLTHRPVDEEAVDKNTSLAWQLIRGFLHHRLGIKFQQKTLMPGYYLYMAIPALRHKLDRFGRNLVEKSFPKKGQLLDFGCGAGRFLDLASRMGWDVHGCDFDPVVVKICQSEGFNVRLGGIDSFSESEKFDVITMNQVIEHLINPQQTLKECYHALNSGGCLWVGTPNPQSSGAKVFGEAWAGLHPPYHLCLPSQNELIRWFNDAGFHRVEILKRGVHAKFNWKESLKLRKKLKIQKIKHSGLKRFSAELINIFSAKKCEETVIIGFKK